MQPPSFSPQALWQLCASLSQQLQEQQKELRQLCTEVVALRARVQAAENRPMYNIERLEYQFDQLKVEKLDGTLNIGMSPPGEQQFKELGQLVIPGQSPSTSGTEQPYAADGTCGSTPQTDACAGKSGGGAGAPPGAIPGTGGMGYPTGTMPSPAMPGSSQTTPAGAAQLSPYTEPLYRSVQQEVNAYMARIAPQKLQQVVHEHGMQLDSYHQRMVIEDVHKQMDTRIRYYIEQAQVGWQNRSIPQSELSAALQTITAKSVHDIDQALQAYVVRLTKQG